GQARDAAGALVQEIFPDATPVTPATMKKVEITLQGAVIGVGMRKRIRTLASLNHLHGWAKNEGKVVRALLCGSQTAIDRVLLTLASLPKVSLSINTWNETVPQGFEVIE